jgi:uncharacterized coiled-coil DUF342 family protein
MKQSTRKLKKHRKSSPMKHRSYAEKRDRLNREVREAKDFTKNKSHGII